MKMIAEQNRIQYDYIYVKKFQELKNVCIPARVV